jgi:anti-sigma factor RsiW
MEAWTHPGPKSACDDARLRASLALDDALDDVGLLRLRSHLEACPSCASFVAEIGSAVALLRRAPLEGFRCELPGSRLLRSCTSPGGRGWAGAAVAVFALVLATASLPGASDPTSRLGSTVAAAPPPRHSVIPFKLPIGQRSAVDDFRAAPHTPPTGA